MTDSGLTLPEIAVSAAIFMVLALSLLAVLGASRRSFEQTEQATEMQQQVRSGFELMERVARAAGYRTDPDGDAARPDEPIEGAWSGALFVRADFDETDPTVSDDPEQDIAGAFGTATTGNDEIVGFVLRKPDGTGGVDLVFEADVHSAVTVPSTRYGQVAERDGAVESITISNVHLVQDDPPYVLYRVRLNNDSAAWGSRRFASFSPVSDDIRSLSFSYEDEAGSPVPAPGGLESASAQRGRIRRIAIELEGLTVDPDLRWSDPADPSFRTHRHRKLRLTGSVAPPNLGSRAIPATAAAAPIPPGPAGLAH